MGAAEEQVVALVAGKPIPAPVAAQLVVTRAGEDAIVAGAAAQGYRCRRPSPDRLQAEDVAGQGDDVELAGPIHAKRGDLAQRRLGARELRRAQGDLAGGAVDHTQRPDRAGNEVGEEVAALQRRLRASVDVAAGDRLAEVAAVLEDRRDGAGGGVPSVPSARSQP